jgi:hypothetical protein
LRARRAVAAAAVGSALLAVGALIWFVPFLAHGRQSVAEVPAPVPLKSITQFALAPGQQACMSYVAVTPNSRLARFRVRAGTAQGGPPIELILHGAGYESRTRVPGGYRTGSATVQIVPPKEPLLGTACFVDRGNSAALLVGTVEPRTVSRSSTRIDGRPVVGDIAIAFLDSRRRALIDSTPEIFSHASNLTDHLVPVWLIWILAFLVVLGVPIGTMAAFYVAMRDDLETSAN